MSNTESSNARQDRLDTLMTDVAGDINSNEPRVRWLLEHHAVQAAEWLVKEHSRESDEALVTTLRGLLPRLKNLLAGGEVNVFFSYKDKDGPIARTIAKKLESWSAGKLKVKHMADLSVDQVGRTTWRKEIERTIAQCDWFLLLLPTPGDERDWVVYEAGYFSRGQGLAGRLVCLHHPDNKVSDALRALQSVSAEVGPVRAFLEALFRRSNWIPGMPALNPDLNQLDDKAAEIAELIKPPTGPGVKFCCGPHMEVAFDDASAVRGWEQLQRGRVIDSNKDCEQLFGLQVPKTSFGDWVREVPGEFDLRLMSWGDGSGVPTSDKNLVIVGTDNNSLLHIRIFDANGERVTDTDETKLLSTQEGAISTLKQQLLGLQSHELSGDEKTNVITEVTSIVRQILPEEWITRLARAVQHVGEGREVRPIDASFRLASGRRVQPKICAIRRRRTDPRVESRVESIDILFNDAELPPPAITMKPELAALAITLQFAVRFRYQLLEPFVDRKLEYKDILDFQARRTALLRQALLDRRFEDMSSVRQRTIRAFEGEDRDVIQRMYERSDQLWRQDGQGEMDLAMAKGDAEALAGHVKELLDMTKRFLTVTSKRFAELMAGS